MPKAGPWQRHHGGRSDLRGKGLCSASVSMNPFGYGQDLYPLVMTNKKLWKITILNGKNHYKWLMTNKKLLNITIEIVDFPIDSMVDLSIVL